jgi:hypothetical protein
VRRRAVLLSIGSGSAVAQRETVEKRSVIIVLLVLVAGCATSTAHRLPLAGNPLRFEATACELRCRTRLPAPTRVPSDEAGPLCDAANQVVDRGPYAACLDSCPGATAVDGAACAPPTPGVVCEQTSRANPGAIAGGVVAVVALVVAAILVAAASSLFNAEQRGLGLPGGR